MSAASLLGRLLAPVRRRRSVILGYHGVAPRPPAGSDPRYHCVPPKRFLAHVDLLLGAGFELVTVGELAARRRAGETAGLAALSFDDGMDNNHSVLLPLLRRRGLPATVFVATGLIGQGNPWLGPAAGGRMMGERELLELDAAGVELGAHTVTHPDLSRLGREACLREMVDSRRRLERLTGHPVLSFAYPYCRYAPPAVRAAREAGFAAAVAGDGFGGDGPFELPRQMITAKDGPASFALKVAGLYDPLFHSVPGRLARGATRALRRAVRARLERRG